ncbi:WXG100 family type VII secretion target [Mycobacterium hubeiense]|uniref:WXG100 family type VII secretion target n=1 Tax=Mycobacterium hubeiense TaxID=1867256 RepID=UPI000C7ED591|nr:WXG100 family type VII secretion target [Mycobacterium sp. QGD 101]
MSVVGADAEQLRATAAQFSHAADRLQGSLKGLSSFVSNAGFWRGPDSERFRSEWNGQAVYSLNAAVEALRNGAEVLRRNADEQEQASRSDGGGASGSGSLMCYEQSANGLHGMWKEIQEIPNTDGSTGYRVQKVIGADGVERYIVYIGGTFGSETQSLDKYFESAWFRKPDENQLRALERLIPQDAEVMLVGYSQGGADAQNIAALDRLNVTQVVTFGAPVRNDLDVPAVHLQAKGDPVLGSSHGYQGGPTIFEGQSDIKSVNPFDIHAKGYDDLSLKWDKESQTLVGGRAANAAEGLNKFQGDIVGQADIDKNGNGSW